MKVHYHLSYDMGLCLALIGRANVEVWHSDYERNQRHVDKYLTTRARVGNVQELYPRLAEGLAMSECRLCAGQGHWITLRYARQLNLTDKEISALPTLLAEAPNGIYWSLVQATADQYHKEVD